MGGTSIPTTKQGKGWLEKSPSDLKIVRKENLHKVFPFPGTPSVSRRKVTPFERMRKHSTLASVILKAGGCGAQVEQAGGREQIPDRLPAAGAGGCSSLGTQLKPQ